MSLLDLCKCAIKVALLDLWRGFCFKINWISRTRLFGFTISMKTFKVDSLDFEGNCHFKSRRTSIHVAGQHRSSKTTNLMRAWECKRLCLRDMMMVFDILILIRFVWEIETEWFVEFWLRPLWNSLFLLAMELHLSDCVRIQKRIWWRFFLLRRHDSQNLAYC